MEIEKKTMSAVATMMRALANETRLSILYKLYDSQKTWTELMFELKLNPKSLRDHLDYLRKNGLVERREPAGFGLTDAAKEFMESNLPQIIFTVKQALEIAQST